jgi:hypothetical protein
LLASIGLRVTERGQVLGAALYTTKFLGVSHQTGFLFTPSVPNGTEGAVTMP